jgi:hypothetical protein
MFGVVIIYKPEQVIAAINADGRYAWFCIEKSTFAKMVHSVPVESSTA